MGYLEAAVVVYLRAIYYPEGFSFPLKPMDPGILGVEIGREAATVVMIFAVAWAAARSRWQTLIGFALVFGVWDIAYYVGLKILLGWPASPFELDVLFLIPIVWVGPVWAPSLIALPMPVAAWALWPMDYGVIEPRAWEWSLMIAAGCKEDAGRCEGFPEKGSASGPNRQDASPTEQPVTVRRPLGVCTMPPR